MQHLVWAYSLLRPAYPNIKGSYGNSSSSGLWQAKPVNLSGPTEEIFSHKEKLDWAVNGMPSKILALSANVANSMIDIRKNNVALALPYHVGKSCSKFG